MTMVRRPIPSMRWTIRVAYASAVHHRVPSMRWRVHGQKSVHEVEGPWSKIRPLVHLKIIIVVRCPNLSMRWTVWAQNLGPLTTDRCPHGQVDGWTVRRRSSKEACCVILLNGLPGSTVVVIGWVVSGASFGAAVVKIFEFVWSLHQDFHLH